MARCICASCVDPSALQPFIACRLIALDKCPGVRLIGIGQVVRRIIGRAIISIIKDDIQAAAGTVQLYAGQEAGCEATVHAMKQVFESPDADAVILVDATNAINTLNRENALRNIQHLCPPIAKVLINTYREGAPLYIDAETLVSQEGITLGDPLAMAMYGIAVIPLIRRVANEQVQQVWFADNATAGAQLTPLRDWWDQLRLFGPDYGYFPNASKTWLIVKDDKLEAATAIYQDTGISITTQGKRHLGAALGTRTFVEEYVQQKVMGWIQEVERLSSVAIAHPHAAYAAFTHGLSSRWTYIARTIPDIGDLLRPLEEAIRHHFLPSLTGRSAFSDAERDLMALPVRLGGLGIANSTQQASHHHNTSQKATAPLIALILQQSNIYSPESKDKQNLMLARIVSSDRHKMQLSSRKGYPMI